MICWWPTNRSPRCLTGAFVWTILLAVTLFLTQEHVAHGWGFTGSFTRRHRTHHCSDRWSIGPFTKSVDCRMTSSSASAVTTDAAMPTTASSSSKADMVRQVLTETHPLPKVIVFDLDNTLWTPELYQIRNLKRNAVPVVNRDIRLFDDAQIILQVWYDLLLQDGGGSSSSSSSNVNRPILALASRTSKTQWAEQLLDDFEIEATKRKQKVSLRSLFSHIEIQTGSKKTHFANLRQATGVAYSEMLFIDDDARLNCREISEHLGVLSCHTPRGVTVEHFVKALQKYSELKAGHDASHWMGYVLNSDNLGIEEQSAAPVGQVLTGRVKFYSPQKRFGFVLDVATGQEFFVHESKVPAEMKNIKAGDQVKFEALPADPRGRASAVILGPAAGVNGSGGDNATTQTAAASSTITMPCFTMSQPFAALLLNGVKTVESRNNPMFEGIKPGTKLLLHCGRRDWHDLESYREILANANMKEDVIDRMGQLPRGFRKGNIVGVVTVGRTWKTTDAERRGKPLQRQVLAPFEGIGKFCTEITSAEWLAKPVVARGNPGIYQAEIPKKHLPKPKS